MRTKIKDALALGASIICIALLIFVSYIQIQTHAYKGLIWYGLLIFILAFASVIYVRKLIKNNANDDQNDDSDEQMLKLKDFNSRYLNDIWKDGFTAEKPEWTKWNAPYFNDYTAYRSFSSFKQSSITEYLLSHSCKAITINDQAIGMVSKNWIDKTTLWLEIGIVIYNPNYWHGGLGTRALEKWITDIFSEYPDLEHIGLTTWSGNVRMMHLAEKIGLKKEAQIRKVRYFQGFYYDSVKYGILRSEWKKCKNK